MASRSNLESRVQGRPRRTTVVQDVKDSLAGAGRAVGGMIGSARDALRGRGRQIDQAIDDSVTGPATGKGKYE